MILSLYLGLVRHPSKERRGKEREKERERERERERNRG